VTLEGLHYSETWSNIGRAACEASSATWNLCTNSAFALGSRKTTENLDRVGRSQELPDANWLVASSPELNTRTLTLFPIPLSLSLPVSPTWRIGHPWNALFHFGFLIRRPSEGLLGQGINPSQGRYLHKQNKYRQTSMPWVGFKPTIPVFERGKTVHALDHVTTVIGQSQYLCCCFICKRSLHICFYRSFL
jgi:hypothetical protein